jgi:hypothetical protein
MAENTSTLPAIANGENLPVVTNNKELHAMVHAVFTPEKFNVLVPQALSFGQNIKVAINLVQLDAKINPTTKRSKDFWSIDGEEYILSSNAIRKLAGAANVQWVADLCGIEMDEYDQSGLIIRGRYKAVCIVTTSLGVVKNGVGTYEYNYAADLKDARFREKEQDPQTKKWLPGEKVKWNQVNQRRQFAIQLIESGAKARAIYDAIGTMERSYSKADIAKPFVIPCAIHNIDYSDPAIKQMLAKQALGITEDLYGPTANNRAISAPAEVTDIPPANVNKETGEVTEKPATQATPELPAEPLTPTDNAPDKRTIFINDWKAASNADRAKEIKRLAIKIYGKWDEEKWHDPEAWAPDGQMTWLISLAERDGLIPKVAANAS